MAMYAVFEWGTTLEEEYSNIRTTPLIRMEGGVEKPYLLVKEDSFSEAQSNEIFLLGVTVFVNFEKVHQWLNNSM